MLYIFSARKLLFKQLLDQQQRCVILLTRSGPYYAIFFSFYTCALSIFVVGSFPTFSYFSLMYMYLYVTRNFLSFAEPNFVKIWFTCCTVNILYVLNFFPSVTINTWCGYIYFIVLTSCFNHPKFGEFLCFCINLILFFALLLSIVIHVYSVFAESTSSCNLLLNQSFFFKTVSNSAS